MPAKRKTVLPYVIIIMQAGGYICTLLYCRKPIRVGDEAVESPNYPGFFYHRGCFEKLIPEDKPRATIVITDQSHAPVPD